MMNAFDRKEPHESWFEDPAAFGRPSSVKCKACNGTGRVKLIYPAGWKREPQFAPLLEQSEPCFMCQGTGQVVRFVRKGVNPVPAAVTEQPNQSFDVWTLVILAVIIGGILRTIGLW